MVARVPCQGLARRTGPIWWRHASNSQKGNVEKHRSPGPFTAGGQNVTSRFCPPGSDERRMSAACQSARVRGPRCGGRQWHLPVTCRYMHAWLTPQRPPNCRKASPRSPGPQWEVWIVRSVFQGQGDGPSADCFSYAASSEALEIGVSTPIPESEICLLSDWVCGGENGERRRGRNANKPTKAPLPLSPPPCIRHPASPVCSMGR